MSEVFDQIKQAVMAMKIEEAVRLTRQALDSRVDVLDILNQALIPSLKSVGERFRKDEIFLPEVMLSARAFQAGFEILKPLLMAGKYSPKAKVVIGTVQGDVHDIGKNIVSALLEGNGYQVVDLGVNVPAQRFVDAVKNHSPQILAMSTLLTTTMPEMEKVIKALQSVGLRGKVKAIIGGAPVTREFAEKIQADGYGDDAQEGVDVVNHLIETK